MREDIDVGVTMPRIGSPREVKGSCVEGRDRLDDEDERKACPVGRKPARFALCARAP